MERRQFLATFGSASTLPALAGCTDDGPPARSDDAPSLSDSRGPVRGESDADVSVRDVETDDTVEYRPEDDTVRYVAGWRSTNRTATDGEPERTPEYETISVERWVETRCLSAAASAASDHVESELGVDDIGGGITNEVDGRDTAAFVSVETELDRDGRVIDEASVEFDALVAATPGSVDVTYVLDGEEFDRTVSVYALYRVTRRE